MSEALHPLSTPTTDDHAPTSQRAASYSSLITHHSSLLNQRRIEVRVPASTSNLGAGFDCFGLALQLYLVVRATVARNDKACRVRSRGAGADASLPRDEGNLVYQAMRFAAEREDLELPPLRLAVHSEIPLGSGLGSSAAAIIAGMSLCGEICERDIPEEKILRYATEYEGHPDNVAASLYGSWVTCCTKPNGEVIALKRSFPTDIKIIVVTPHLNVQTKYARAQLASTISRADAVHNLQRAALFGAALETKNYELLWEAMQDRIHQECRAALVPGLAEALATSPLLPGLLGVAVSGAGPSVLALAGSNFDLIGNSIADCFRRRDINATVRLLDVDAEGRRVSTSIDHEPAFT